MWASSNLYMSYFIYYYYYCFLHLCNIITYNITLVKCTLAKFSHWFVQWNMWKKKQLLFTHQKFLITIELLGIKKCPQQFNIFAEIFFPPNNIGEGIVHMSLTDIRRKRMTVNIYIISASRCMLMNTRSYKHLEFVNSAFYFIFHWYKWDTENSTHTYFFYYLNMPLLTKHNIVENFYQT
jgi:hypothetical protein